MLSFIIPRKIYTILHSILFIAALLIVSWFFPYQQSDTEHQQLARQKLLDEHGKIQQVLFSPDDMIREVLLGLISLEKERIIVASYVITDRAIAEALITAHKRGVRVEIVTCRSGAQEGWSKINLLIAAKIPVYVYPAGFSRSLMHNKFIIFFSVTLGNGQKMIIGTGSYNMTNAASDTNQESFIFLEQRSIIKKYIQRFEHLKKHSIRTRTPSKA